VVTVLRLVEASLGGSVQFVVRAAPTAMSTAMSTETLADSLAALVCGAASKCAPDRHIRITVTQTELRDGSASAAGVLPGAYVVFEIDDEPSAGRHPFRVLPIDTGIRLTAARDAIVGAGGSIGLSQRGTGGMGFTAFVPVRPPGGHAADGNVIRNDAHGPWLQTH
jgi:hypothetical protein